MTNRMDRTHRSAGMDKGKFQTEDPQKASLPYILDSTKTDFVPGILDHSTLPQRLAPSNATPDASKVLSQALKATLAVQASTPLHDLGWYIDPKQISNLYQWIVELHSFPADHPLAQDMKQASVRSIVFEIRFPASFPHSPPFLRIVRPRLLSFSQGGGGHTTAEGSMCLHLLTSGGWNPEATIEGVLLLVRLALQNPDPTPARLMYRYGQQGHDYDSNQAMSGYMRVAAQHGWSVPQDFWELRSPSGLGARYY